MAINLNKITLEKQGDSHKIDLTKGGSDLTKEIIVNLNWSQPEKKKGFFANLFSGNQEIDLDLGCFYELADGRKSVIDGLQFAHGVGGPRNKPTRQGCYIEAPWVWHSGDDRSGAGEGENILVNPTGIGDLKRMIIYCFIYDGVARWDLSNGIATVKVTGNPDIVVEMGKQTDPRKFCAVAEILFDKESITVKKLVSFHNGHEECDKVYTWGMKWEAGSK
ncbi:MAG: stress protein [Prevotellaceae bacterium]|jgi:tellurite resistance protein TerA|nr:stress protein [Prevotellaceae bacterium]